jgi:hypothetical protein
MSKDELGNVHPAKMAEASWPHWSEGVPTKLCREVYALLFIKARSIVNLEVSINR